MIEILESAWRSGLVTAILVPAGLLFASLLFASLSVAARSRRPGSVSRPEPVYGIEPSEPWPRPGPITTPIRLDDAARLYRFVSGHAGVEDCAATRCDDLRGLAWAPDFDTFCAYNRMRVYEEVIR